jgi:amino acid transporter
MSIKNIDIGVSPTDGHKDIEASPGGNHDGDFVTHLENNNLQRGLRQRHIQMIAIAGAIGTGLFL